MKKSIANVNPSDVAVCFDANSETVTAASFSPTGGIEIQKFLTSAGIYQSLKEWRDSLGLDTDLQTVFRLVPSLFTEQTHIAALSDEVIQLDDKDLTLWLIDAADKQISGEDGILLFESGLENSVYDFARLPDGRVSLTELPRERLHEAVKTLFQAEPLDSDDLTALTRSVDDFQPGLLHAVETRLRAITRCLVNSEYDFFNSIKSDESMAVFAFTPEGCGFALWNRFQGFYAEYGEWFNLNFDENEVPVGTSPADYIGQLYLESVYNFLHEQFYKRIVPEDDLQPAVNVKSLIWTSTEGLSEPLVNLLAEFTEQTSFKANQAGGLGMEEMIVRGLLLAYDENAESQVSSINLANDISVQNDSINAEELNLKAISDRSKRRTVFACLMLPVVLALGAVIGLWLNNQRIAVGLALRESRGNAEQTRLKPILQARADYEKTLNWYQDVLRQIIALRQKQTSSLSFAARLDPLFPSTEAFYISDMKIAPGGTFEIKGITRDQMEVSKFVNSLEFAQDEKESRYFTGIQLEFKQGSNLSGITPISATGSTLSGNLAPGVSAFVLKGNYVPAAVLKAQQPAQPVPPSPATSPANANTATNSAAPPNSAAANTNSGVNK